MKRPWMPFYGGRFILQTRHLSPSDRASYLSLMWYCWERDGSILDDDDLMRRVVSAPSGHWNGIKRRLRSLFDEASKPGYWVHAELSAEILRMVKISNKRKDAALQMHCKCTHTLNTIESKKDKIPPSAGSDGYAFEYGVVHLSEKDLSAWKRAFGHINVESVLTASADWLGKQQGNWFVIAANLLAKKEQDAKARAEKPAPPRINICR